jgi:excisionase family DNA binding protein
MERGDVMPERLDLPNLPEYVTIKQASQILEVSDKRVYKYISEGRLPAMRAGRDILLPIKDVQEFKPRNSGRPRKNTPLWRLSKDNQLITLLITVQIQLNQQEHFQEIVKSMRQVQSHLFDGTIARYVIESQTQADQIKILLIWRSAVLPDEPTRQHTLEAFRQTFVDILDWENAYYDEGIITLHS